MKILPKIDIIDLALKIGNTLIIADTHIGYEEALNKQGMFIPRFQLEEIIKRLKKIIGKKKFELIIINGDIKHEFGKISEQEWRNTLRLLDFLSKHTNKIILIKGNHDKILGPIARKRNIEVVSHYKIGDIYICHGDKMPKDTAFKSAKTIIIGHLHPAISLREGARTETFKCYLKGKYKNKNLIIMPSFNLITEGTDILKEAFSNPFMRNLDNFDVFLVEDKVYRFGKVKDIK